MVLTSPEGVDENNGGRDDYGPTKTLHYPFVRLEFRCAAKNQSACDKK